MALRYPKGKTEDLGGYLYTQQSTSISDLLEVNGVLSSFFDKSKTILCGSNMDRALVQLPRIPQSLNSHHPTYGIRCLISHAITVILYYS